MSVELKENVKLNPKQELFCQYFASDDTTMFGNGTKAYMKAYPDSSLKAAAASAADLLRNPNVLKRINELLEFNGFNDADVDKQLLVVISQSADFGSKVAAIREYNKLKARITDKSEQLIVADVTSNGETVGTSQLDAIMQTLKDTTAKQA